MNKKEKPASRSDASEPKLINLDTLPAETALAFMILAGGPAAFSEEELTEAESLLRKGAEEKD